MIIEKHVLEIVFLSGDKAYYSGNNADELETTKFLDRARLFDTKQEAIYYDNRLYELYGPQGKIKRVINGFYMYKVAAPGSSISQDELDELLKHK